MDFKETLNTFSSRTAVILENSETVTYNRLSERAVEIYQNIGHRCLVFCLCQNTIGSLAGYLSFVTNNVVPLLLDASMDHGLLMNLINIYKPQFMWLPDERLRDFKQGEIVYSGDEYRLIRVNNETNYPLSEELALLLTTSGSTGSPKLVRISYENLISNAQSIAEYLEIDGQEKPVTSLPMHYSFGLSVINSHFLKGASILLTNRTLLEKEFWSFVRNEEATSFSGVPYAFEILKKLRFFKMDLPHLKTITQAGGKLNNELNGEFAEFCRQKEKRFFVMYGQTEATARMSYLPHQFSLEKVGSMGIAIPGGTFSLVDENGNTIEENGITGELVYHGKNVSLGYAECGEDLIKSDENRGRLVTGDLAMRDGDGFYYIVGRKKRFIKIYGNRVNLDETERLLKNILSDCACSGSDDHMRIFITDASRKDEILLLLTSKTGIHPQAFTVSVVEQIPKNSSGKTIYSLLPNG